MAPLTAIMFRQRQLLASNDSDNVNGYEGSANYHFQLSNLNYAPVDLTLANCHVMMFVHRG